MRKFAISCCERPSLLLAYYLPSHTIEFAEAGDSVGPHTQSCVERHSRAFQKQKVFKSFFFFF